MKVVVISVIIAVSLVAGIALWNSAAEAPRASAQAPLLAEPASARVVDADGELGAAAFLAEETDPRHSELVASLRLHLQVELDEPLDRADRLQVFDVDGKRVLLSVFHGQGAHASSEMPILDGRSAVLSVEERAATLALYRGAEEFARLPLRLSAGPPNLVRW
jgi:hypothetical protein